MIKVNQKRKKTKKVQIKNPSLVNQSQKDQVGVAQKKNQRKISKKILKKV